MGVIETEEAAKRLARVIVSDIEIYNREKFQAGADLTAAFEEGRALFRTRVAPELVPLFSTVLEDRRANRKKPTAPAPRAVAPEEARAAAEPMAPLPVDRAASPPAAIAEPPASAPAAVAPMAAAPPAAVERAAVPAAAAPATERPAPTPAPTPAPSRAGIIDTEEAAARLARVILSDVELYNAKKIASGSDLSYEIDEGRSLFKKRVSAERFGIFETVLAAKGLGQRRRTASPAPVAKARPAAVTSAPAATPAPTPAPVPVAASPRASAPPAAARPSVSAVHAPPTSQPRPGVAAPPRRPTPAPLSIPVALTDSGSARHFVPPATYAASGSRPGIAAPLSSEDVTPIPGRSEEPTPQLGVSPVPTQRAVTPRPPATPPPMPVRPPTSPTPMRTVTGAHAAVPHQRERPPSAPQLPIHVDSAPFQYGTAHENLPSQEILDALPAPEPRAAHAAPPVPLPRNPTPAFLQQPTLPPASLPRIPTPPSLPQTAAPTLITADSPIDEQVVSLRGGMSKARMVLTAAALGASGAVLWYFFLR